MAITKVKSKKHGVTYQVDVKYDDILGIKRRHVKSGFLEMKEAKKYEKDFLDKVEADLQKKKENNLTFNELYLEYMELEGNNKYSNGTKMYYNATFDTHIKNKIGKQKLSSIKYVDLQKFFNECAKQHNRPTLRNIKKIFSVSFNYALRVGYTKENPVKLIQLPKDVNEVRAKVETISDEDLNKIINRIQKVGITNPYRKDRNPKFTFMSYAMALIIGRYTGLRIGECLALHKEDFDFEKKTMNVHRKIEYAGLSVKNIYATEEMKTDCSKAKVAISDKLIEYLKPWFEVNPYNIVICNSEGEYIYPATLEHRIREIRQELGIHFHYHMLRHTYATELMMSGANPVVVKDLLRHSEVNTTSNIYTHPQDSDQREALDNLYQEMK